MTHRKCFRLLLCIFLCSLVSLALAQPPEPTPTVDIVPSASPTATPSASPSVTPPPATPESAFPILKEGRGLAHELLAGDGTRARLRGPFSGKYLLTLSGAEGYSAKDRAEMVFERLQTVAQSQGSEATLVTSRVFSGVVVLFAGETVLATVMPEDLNLIKPRAIPLSELRDLELGVAEEWRVALQWELGYASLLQRPEYFKIALPFLGLILMATWGGFAGLNKVKARYPNLQVRTPKTLILTFTTIFTLWVFPKTKQVAWSLNSTVLWPIVGFLILATTASFTSYLIERLIRSHFKSLTSEPGTRPRRVQRLQTLCVVLTNTVRGIVYIMAVAIGLSLLPFHFMPLVTSAGVMGVAIGLAAQDFLKDFFAGITILLEDRFGVGDWIEWGSYSGEVVSITLRATRVRTVQGGLITVPNADLRVVNNQSNEWSQVDFRVGVSYNTDIPRALEVLMEEANLLASDWNDKILEPPSLKGVQELGDSAIVLRLSFKTQPLEQWVVEREFNLRIKSRFDSEGIEIPFPQSTVWIRQEKGDNS